MLIDSKTRQSKCDLTPSVFKSPASFVHLVLPCNTPFHDIYVARTVDRLGEFPGLKNPLFALEDVEVVVGRMKAGMSLGTKRGAENDQVLGDGRMYNVHGAHRASGVVEYPFRSVRVEDDGGRCFMEGYCPQRCGRRELGVFGRKVRYNVPYNPVHVVSVGRNSVLGETVEVCLVKHIPPVLQTRNEHISGHQNATANATDLNFVEPPARRVGEV